MQKEITLDKKV